MSSKSVSSSHKSDKKVHNSVVSNDESPNEEQQTMFRQFLIQAFIPAEITQLTYNNSDTDGIITDEERIADF